MTPKLRFPEFDGPWAAKHGANAFKSRRERAWEGLPLYSVTMGQGMVRRDSLDREFSSNAPDEANLRAAKGDQVYNMMRMWQGAVGRAPEECMVSPAYVVLAPKAETASEFFDYWFKRQRSLYWLWAYSYGLTSDRLRLYARDFAQVPMHLPNLDEQKKIAAFLVTVDERIELLRQKRAELERYKRGVMRHLFAQTLRFKREDGNAFPDWEERQFSKFAFRVGDKFDPATASSAPLTIELENIESGTGRVVGQSVLEDQQSLKGVFRPGDILFGKLRPYLRKFWFADQSGICSSEIWVLRPRGIVGKFVYYLMQTERFMRNANQSSGSKMPRADWGIVGESTYAIPHPDEQHKIVDFLSALDHKLTSIAAKIDAMLAFKKGLLQRMFV